MNVISRAINLSNDSDPCDEGVQTTSISEDGWNLKKTQVGRRKTELMLHIKIGESVTCGV